MKRYLVYVLILGVLCFVGGSLVGAGLARRAVVKQFGERKREMAERLRERFEGKAGARKGADEMRQRLLGKIAEKLDLSADQKAKVEIILDETRQEITAAKDTFMASLKDIRERSRGKISAMLTPEQQEKLKKMGEDGKAIFGKGGSCRRPPRRPLGPQEMGE